MSIPVRARVFCSKISHYIAETLAEINVKKNVNCPIQENWEIGVQNVKVGG
jgi:hypothetical protein